jgi:hypothetical protein
MNRLDGAEGRRTNPDVDDDVDYFSVRAGNEFRLDIERLAC